MWLRVFLKIGMKICSVKSINRANGRDTMSYTIYVRMKKPGKKMNKEASVVSFELGKRPETVRELLIGVEETRDSFFLF